MQNNNFIIEKGSINNFRQELTSIWQQTLFEDRPEQISKRLDWLDTNPYGPCEVYLIKTNSGELVGSAGIIPRLFVIDGYKSRMGGLHTDIAILPEYRKNIQPILVLFKSVFEDAKQRYDFLYATPSDVSKFIFKRYKYTPVPFNGFVRVLDLTPYIAKKVSNQFLVKTSASILNLMNRGLLLTKWLQKDNNFTVSPISDLFLYQDLIDNYCLLNDNTGDRSFLYVDWRYRMYPHPSTYQIFAQDDGIIIFKNQDNVITIMDIFCDTNNSRLLNKLLHNFQRYCFITFDARIIMFGAITSEQQVKIFKSHHFMKTISAYSLWCWGTDVNISKIDYTFADGDVIL